MADIADRAQVINEQFQSDIIARARQPKQTQPSRTHCAECEEPIPKERREAMPGCKFCLECQEKEDNILKHWRTT